MSTAVKRAVAFVRVSTKEQGKSGFGLQSQTAIVTACADASGYVLERVFSEVGTAIGKRADQRPELQAALEYARANGLPIIVASLDRLSRHASEIEAIAGNSAVIIIDAYRGIQADPLVIKVEAGRIAEETRMLRDRTLAGLQRAKQQGRVFGNKKNLPEAQRKGASATQRNAEIRDERIASTILSAQGASRAEIAERLNREGYRTARGKLWSTKNVRRAIERVQRRDRERQQRMESDPSFGRF